MTALDRFYDACREAFSLASNSTESVETSIICPAGLRIRLNFAGADSRDFCMPALRHLEEMDGAKANGPGNASAFDAVEFDIWDRESSGVSLPPRPWAADAHLSRGDIRGFCSDTVRIAYGLGVNAVSMWNEPVNRGLFHVIAPRRIPMVYFGSPCLYLLQWAGMRERLQLVHGAAIGHHGDALLIVGKGGAGKSTSALTCLHEGLDYLGDDYCFVRATPEPEVFSAYCSGKIQPRHLASLPEFQPLVANGHELAREKALLFLYPRFRENIRKQARLRGIIIPRVTGNRASSLEPGPPGLALRLLGASSVFQMAGAGAESLRAIAELVRRLPVFYLNAGTDLPAVAAALYDHLEQLRNAA